jgi:hypothetical protein
MATNKLFNVAGTSKLNGEYKVRFANDTMRIKVLTKSGHEDITLVELPNEMSKLDAIKFIAGLDEFQSVGSKTAIADYLDRNDSAPKTAKATNTKASTPAKKSATPQVKAIKGMTPLGIKQDEDAPF